MKKSIWGEINNQSLNIWDVAEKFPFSSDEIKEQKIIQKAWKKFIFEYEREIVKLENLKKRHDNL